MKRRLAGIFLAGIIALNLTACASNTQTDTQNKKTTITTLYYSTLPEFEKLVESTFDDIDLEIEPSSLSTYNSDTLRRLRNDHGKDLIFTSMLNNEISDYMLDLSANSFTTNFVSSVMDIIQQDGKTVWLPMPSVCKGLIINKTLAKELGKDLPGSQQELKDLMSAAKISGKGADDEGFVFATADIDGISSGELILSTMVPDFLGTMEGERWTNDFINKSADAAGTLEEHLAFFTSLSAEGYMDPSCLHLGITQKNAIPVIERMASRKMTVCYGYSDILQKIRSSNTQDEFVMIPFLSNSGNASWVTTTPASYLGVNAAVAEDKTKLDAVLRILELFSSPEGQFAILKDTKCDTSYLTETVEGSGAANSGLEKYLESGYVYNMNRFSSDIRWLLGINIIKVFTGDMEMSDALISIDNLNKNGEVSYAEDHTLIGSVNADMLYENYNTRREETAIGNLIADSVAESADVDIAFINGGGIRASLYAGDVYTSDLAAVCPYDNTIVVLDVTGETIYRMLENSIKMICYKNIPAGRFLQVSGLHYTFSVDKSSEIADDENNPVPAETKLLKVTLADGSVIEKDKIYRVAVNNYMCGSKGYINGGDDYTMLNVFDDSIPKASGAKLIKDTGKTYAEAVIDYFNKHNNENIHPVLEKRITVQEAER